MYVHYMMVLDSHTTTTSLQCTAYRNLRAGRATLLSLPAETVWNRSTLFAWSEVRSSSPACSSLSQQQQQQQQQLRWRMQMMESQLVVRKWMKRTRKSFAIASPCCSGERFIIFICTLEDFNRIIHNHLLTEL